MTALETEFILYVANQAQSRDFYAYVLELEPVLDVPGITEFALAPQVKLGLMPESGIARLLQPATPHPATGAGIPRCELYWLLPNAEGVFTRALQAGATMVSPFLPRDWGHTVGYAADADGHILAFAQATAPPA